MAEAEGARGGNTESLRQKDRAFSNTAVLLELSERMTGVPFAGIPVFYRKGGIFDERTAGLDCLGKRQGQ